MDPFDPRRAALCTDLHQVAMMAACWEHGHNPRATFELSLRQLPPGRGYAIAAGLEYAILHLSEVRFEADQIRWLNRLFMFHKVREEFWAFLEALRFTGEVWAAPEGTPVFAGEPLLRVTAPLIEAQMLEPWLSSVVGYSSAAATQAARLVQAAAGREIVDYATAAAPTATAAVLAARAAYAMGFAGTTNAQAGWQLGIPIVGNLSHSFVLSFADEIAAIESFHQIFPNAATIALDTHDPLAAAARIAERKIGVRAVHLDSGDRAEIARAVRGVLDDGGLGKTKIVAGGNLDEHAIAALAESGAPIDSFTVGSALVAADAATMLKLDYALVAVDGPEGSAPKARRAGDQPPLAGVKQVYRRFSTDGRAKSDVVALASESQFGAPVLTLTYKDGAWAIPRPGLETMRLYCQQAVATLPPGVRRLSDPEPYPVTFSDPLQALATTGN